jgi:hypothetical protein
MVCRWMKRSTNYEYHEDKNKPQQQQHLQNQINIELDGGNSGRDLFQPGDDCAFEQ